MVEKCDIINKLNKFKQNKTYFFEDIKFKFLLLILTWFLYITWFLLYLLNMKNISYVFYPALLSTSILTTINYYSNFRVNKKLIIISKELNITIFQLKYLIKKFELNDRL